MSQRAAKFRIDGFNLLQKLVFATHCDTLRNAKHALAPNIIIRKWRVRSSLPWQVISWIGINSPNPREKKKEKTQFLDALVLKKRKEHGVFEAEVTFFLSTILNFEISFRNLQG